MTTRSRYSLLHLQMGQEVIYLILTAAVVASLFLLAILNLQYGDLTEARRSAKEVPQLRDDLERAREAVRQSGSGAIALEAALRERDSLKREVADLKRVNSDLMSQIASLQTQLRGGGPAPSPDEKPPILTLSEAKGYFFRFGSAELDDNFRDSLIREVIPALLRDGPRYSVNVIEIVGHTDEVPIARGVNNLDRLLLPFLRGEAMQIAPHGVDNVGLGMSRAAAVARVLLTDGRLDKYVVVPYSAGQTIDIDGTLAQGTKKTDEKERRRIEIRLRRPDR